MAEYKYEVGDEFKWYNNTRKIVARYKDDGGDNRYVVSYSEGSEDETAPETYIADTYTKIERFFEEGKKYRYRGSEEKNWTCHVVTKVLGRKIALMTYDDSKDPDTFQQHEFSRYREVE